jgi:Zn-dependent peptidase ImmA (M78 family)
MDVRLKWLWEISAFLAELVRFPEPNIPPLSLDHGDAYSLPEIEHIATQTRRHWQLGDGPIANVVALLETHGAVLSRFAMGSENVDAFSCWLSKRPYIVLGSGKQSAVRSRFDAAHELAHLILHQDVSQEDLESPKVRTRVEREANQFAGAFLLPRPSLLAEFYSNRLSHLQGLKRRWRVSMQALAHRAMQIGALDEDQYINFRKQMSSQKWLTSEPPRPSKSAALWAPKK